MNRRKWMASMLGSAAALTAAQVYGQQQPTQRQNRQPGTGGAGGAGARNRTLTKYDNEHFMKDGKFDYAIAKEAYAELFRFHRFAIADKVLNAKPDPKVGSTDFWVLNFGLNDFVNVGMAGIFYCNFKEEGYFAHDIFLLPGQMIAEHYHVPAEGKPAKHEFWHVRHGSCYTFRKGGTIADVPAGVVLPKSQLDAKAITAFISKFNDTGDYDVLNKLEEPHFMIAGPQGAIVSEYASYHSNEGLRFTNPKASNKE